MRLLAVLGVLLATGGLTWWLLVHDTRGAEIANVLALPIAVVGVLLTIYGLWKPRGSEDDEDLGSAKKFFVCLKCGKMGRTRLSHGTIGLLPCPRCGTLISAELKPDGRVRVAYADEDHKEVEWANLDLRVYPWGYRVISAEYSDEEKNRLVRQDLARKKFWELRRFLPGR